MLQPVKVFLSARTARSRSRLNSAAPYRMQAWPPMSRKRTRRFWIEERTLTIGLGVKRSSQGQEGGPQLLGFGPALCRCQRPPLEDFRVVRRLIAGPFLLGHELFTPEAQRYREKITPTATSGVAGADRTLARIDPVLSWSRMRPLLRVSQSPGCAGHPRGRWSFPRSDGRGR